MRAPRAFQEKLWKQFGELDDALRKHLDEVTERVIRTAVHNDASDAVVVNDPGQLPP